MMKQTFALLILIATAISGYSQTKVGDKWMDNNLAFEITYEAIRTEGRMDICIADTSRDACIENLQSGFEVKVFDASNTMIWEGIGSGRTNMLKLPKALPNASYVTIMAFKPFVTNKSTGTKIHQDKRIEIKHTIK
ncbi:hypothetical protein Oweho_2806 [Owenweeksia hongkongensis DSM 17368]|uniref:Uncharacterized protein n=1 Tax=Owenweeksia hongkongensis (strain DSM 17368 / CIP 108786 / JCM 12287 / NRRL B-23963 / UST20020801) TaxID=926562 RepID=G8R0A0_OWEHD|nr:hypothetical protein [Owenweeksia hongkongensis]AEV33766.1 hypothetical protein Oweho_2806 [Owenweeksia hongkongensis DSM 17368]